MKSITIHKIEEALAERLEQEAQRRRQSINRTVKEILEKALLGDRTDPSYQGKQGYYRFLGLWSPQEGVEIQKALEEFETVNPEDWKEGHA